MIFAGVGGLAWSSFGMPGAMWLVSRLRRRSLEVSAPIATSPLLTAPSLEIVVPVFNEQSVIVPTLESLVAAVERLREQSLASGGLPRIQIRVGLDHCTDQTAERVAELAARVSVPVVGVPNEGPRGKWNTLMMLIDSSEADWVACVDAGSVWDAGLLAAALPLMRDPSVMGVAPSYSPQSCGGLERMNWRLERALKDLENASGGPVSVHGATVLYRRSTLLTALASLRGSLWLNDDVAIPLTLRLQNPALRIAYLAAGAVQGWVSDVGVKADLKVELGRRRRIVMGNLQWIRGILLPRLLVLLIASRRVFRVLWAYWLALIAAGVGLQIVSALADVSGASEIKRAVVLELALLVAAVVAAGGLLFSNWVRRVAVAFGSGLMVSRYWRELAAKRSVSWV